MKTKKIFIAVILVLALITSVFVFLNNQPGTIKNDPVLTNDNGGGVVDNVKPSNGKKLSCYDAINTLLEKDGFTYLEGTKWGRGEKNFFIVDLEAKEFQMADPYRLEVLPETWYNTEYERYINMTYRHTTQSVDGFGYDGTNSYVIFTNNTESIMQPTSAFQDFPDWMDYYINQFENYGCSIVNEFNIGKIEEYKTKTSKTTEQGIVSVFDLKSTDGVFRTFNDVHVKGDVKDHPRYKELNSFEEFLALKSEDGFEQFFLISIINHDSSKIYEKGFGNVQANAIEEFVKDVAFQFTPERNDAKMVETLGIYFIDVDNPNGNFKNLYREPIKNSYYSSNPSETFNDLREFSIPFQGTVILANKDDTTGYAHIPVDIYSIVDSLKQYVKFINHINPSVVFSEDFIWNYTRPFAYEWQKQMGLTKLFDEKYGLVDHSIEYMN